MTQTFPDPSNISGVEGNNRASDRPIFVVGCHRSGTTLVRFLLDTHPAIACPPESKLMGAIHDFAQYPQLRLTLSTLGITPERAAADLSTLARSLMGEYAERQGKRRWADKTPNYYRLLPFINDIFGGDAQFLFVVRHPFDTMISLRDFFDHRIGTGADPDVEKMAERFGVGPYCWGRYWSEVYESIETFRAENPENTHLFRYEDLVRTPVETSSGIFDFLGEDFDPGMLRRIFTTHHDVGLEDHKIRLTRMIHDQGVERWRDWKPDLLAAWWRLVEPTAALFDYVPEPVFTTEAQPEAS